MAHLRCPHQRRVVVVRDREENAVIRHRSDGGACNARFVAIDKVLYDPTTHGTAETAGTSQDKMFGPLGPVVTIGGFTDAAVRADKPVRRVKKHRTTKYRGQ